MTKKYTKKPWKVQPFKSWDKDIVILGPGVIVDHDDVDPEEAEANAWLISAAPDLLEALECVVDNVASDSPEMWGKAFDAIAKAKGQT